MADELEKRIASIYNTATKEVTQKFKDYMKQFERLNEQKKALLQAGKITDTEYKTWVRNKMFVGKRWKDLQKELTADMLNADKTALDYVNGIIPEEYTRSFTTACNSNFRTVEGYSFTLVDKTAVKDLIMKDGEALLPKASAKLQKKLDENKAMIWDKKKLSGAITQGMLQGESIPKVAKRLQNAVGMGKEASIRNARTMVNSAENRGRQDNYTAMTNRGFELKKKWISATDSRTRESHLLMNGEIVGSEEKFSNGLMYPCDKNGRPEEVYNCRCTVVSIVTGYKGNKITANLKGTHTPEETLKALEKEKAEEAKAKAQKNTITTTTETKGKDEKADKNKSG